MNNSQFIRCYRNTELATYINRNAKRYAAKRADFRQDLQQEGWAALAGSSSTEEALIKDRARKAIFAAYMRDYR
ncbi:MAG: hypothetical protein JW820_07935, partial [Spirochaetales bacterium]|nr:hypothetical protein [Spirochaetales bacterium]